MWGRRGLSVPPPEADRDDYSGALMGFLSLRGKFTVDGKFNHKKAGLGGFEKSARATRSATE